MKLYFLTCLATGILFVVLLGHYTSLSAGPVDLLNLEGRRVDPLQVPLPASVKAIVFVFTSIECPIANRYAPELRRLHKTFAPQGVRFWLVYPNRGDRPEAIRDHMREFGYPMGALRDPLQELVRHTKVTVTPEAAVFDRTGRIIYRGRIDDRYVDFGLDRPAPTSRDLADALAAMLEGRAVKNATTQAIGCVLADFIR